MPEALSQRKAHVFTHKRPATLSRHRVFATSACLKRDDKHTEHITECWRHVNHNWRRAYPAGTGADLSPAAHLAQAPGSRPPRPPTTRAPFASLQGGFATWPLYACLGCALCGEVLDRCGDLPFVVVVEVTGSFVTMQFATPSAPLSLSSLPFPANWRSPASCSLPGPVTPVAPVLAPTSLLIPTLPLAAGAAPQTFGSSGEPQASLRPGTSRSRPSFAPPFSPQPLVFHEVETRKNSFQITASQVAALGATFRPLVFDFLATVFDIEVVVPPSDVGLMFYASHILVLPASHPAYAARLSRELADARPCFSRFWSISFRSISLLGRRIWRFW